MWDECFFAPVYLVLVLLLVLEPKKRFEQGEPSLLRIASMLTK